MLNSKFFNETNNSTDKFQLYASTMRRRIAFNHYAGHILESKCMRAIFKKKSKKVNEC